MKSVLNILWKDWCWSWSSNTLATWCKESTHWIRPWWWERLKAGEGGNRGWDGWMHHWLNGHESEWTPGVGDGQGGLACCDSWGHKESDMTEQLNWAECTPRRRQWQPTPVLLPGKSHGRRSLVVSVGSHRVGHDWSDLAAAAAYTSNTWNTRK